MARAIRSRPNKVVLGRSMDLSQRQAMRRGVRPSRAAAEEAPHGGAFVGGGGEGEQTAKPRAKRGVGKVERRRKALGPVGRERARVDAIPHGKKGTHAGKRSPRRNASEPTRSKPIRGSPKAKRRIANRRRATH